MAPIRRYLRISKYSVLECRIYLDNPALTQTWLLNPRNPVLPKVIESVRPLVLPKLREEKERSKKKSTKKKGIKDVVVQDDFEVSVFLTETSTRHSLLTKHKHFHEKVPSKLQSNSSKLITATNDAPIEVDDDTDMPMLRREDSDEAIQLYTIPTVDEKRPSRRSKRPRQPAPIRDSGSDSEAPLDDEDATIEITSDVERPPQKRQRRPDAEEGQEDDKKKLTMDVSYEGFAIYGRVLCLVVKKRETQQSVLASRQSTAAGNKPAGQALMENWISSTQMLAGLEGDGS